MISTQTSSSLSPVQEFYQWYDRFEAERKKTKQKKRRGYFFEENERAIIAYNNEPDSILRNKVYS